MPLLLYLLLLGTSQGEEPCTEIATARVASAHGLLEASVETAVIDRAAILERARVLLERTLEEDPTCEAATDLKHRADQLFEEAEPLSTAAAVEETLHRATRAAEQMEQNGTTPPELEALRFQVAALVDRLPGDVRALDLARRVAAIRPSP